MRLKEVFFVVLLVVIAVFVRVYPYLISGLPFSVDAWPSIRYAEILLERTPIRLGDERVFGGYYDELGDRLFGVTISGLMGMQPIQAMAIFLPIAGAMSILILYSFVKKLYNREVSFIASILLATAFTDVILTASVKGETYAHPLYLFLIFLFFNRDMNRWKKTLLFTITSVALVLTHYYTAILSLAILTSIGLAMLIIGKRKGVGHERCNLLFLSILAGSILMYLWLYANQAFNFLSSIDWLSAASYQLVFFVLALYLTLKPQAHSQTTMILKCLTVFAAALIFTWLATKNPIVPGAPTLPTHYLLYAFPFMVASPLCVLGYGTIKKMNYERVIIPLFWLATVLGLEGYAIFGNSRTGLGLTLAYRGVNFVLPPLVILCAVGLHRLHETKRPNMRKLAKMGAVTLTLAILTLNIYGVYGAVSLQERYLGYFCLYNQCEYSAGRWIASNSNQTIAGDVKVQYLVKYYFNAKVDPLQGLRYLEENTQKPEIMFTYNQMLRNGYVIYGGYSIDLPENWIEKTIDLNLVYSNGPVNIHARSTTHN